MKYLNTGILICLMLVTVSCAKRQVIKSVPDSVTVAVPGKPVNNKEPDIRNTKVEPTEVLKVVYFDFDKSELSSETLQLLKTNADYMRVYDSAIFCIEGHCDDRGTVEYNLALGQRRAYLVREYYKMLGIPANRIATISYGEEKPAVEGTGEEVWAKNRRAETKFIYNN